MTRPAIMFVLDDGGSLVDIAILPKTASDPQPTAIELELVRMCKEWKELKKP